MASCDELGVSSDVRDVPTWGRAIQCAVPCTQQQVLSEVIWEERVQSPYWLQRYAPNSPQTALSPSTIIIATYPSIDPTHHPKRHPDPISRFARTHFPDRQTDRPTHGISDRSIPRAAYAVLIVSDALTTSPTYVAPVLSRSDKYFPRRFTVSTSQTCIECVQRATVVADRYRKRRRSALLTRYRPEYRCRGRKCNGGTHPGQGTIYSPAELFSATFALHQGQFWFLHFGEGQ